MSNIRFFVDYFKHYLTSNSRHGVHSPFVYNLIDRVIYDFSTKEYANPIEELREQLKNDTRTIRITDLGAGSMLNNGKVKQIRSLAKNALKPPRVAKLIARLANEFQPASIIELGTCLGITTLYLSKASNSSHIITVEGCPETAKVAMENFKRLDVNNIETRTGNFDILFPQIVEELPRIDFLFIDGNHRKDATLKYFYDCLPKVHAGSILIFDDIYWSEGMKEAWQEIKNHPQVTVTIDLFYIGLVFFKPDQVKENFKVRFH
ncbi:O-methyltransferase [Albibacterium bauzanense]|uniref:Putative O-methyltransferase YrrM n=1 Tax=Albibacterium bauzanense TaxID=653929 RepID=A0A4R1LWI0_9SPHI|nr:class I SAM-dependent methyltransferase [Albibacterium bauzanense]TCK82880.1 putative O-methyltransferase YrrM [Albibacterium bauzanense]